ncbi:hypothetical protein F5B20DRAFT_583233 [Whalleya microplaca]|nr:hypothetical protein F5B20DRAFT_583233 [Whalleya microplaca]
MKTFPIITTLLSVPAFGTVLPRIESDEGRFFVHNLTAGCVPHSVSCSIEFIAVTGPTTTPAKCTFWGPGPDRLPQIPLTPCSDLNTSFSFEHKHGFYPLTIVSALSLGKNRTGTYYVPESEIVIDDHGSVKTERYEGPSDFTVSDVTTVQV